MHLFAILVAYFYHPYTRSRRLLFFVILLAVLNPLILKAQQANLVAHYTFNESTNDQSGNSNHAINNGASFTTDRFGNSNRAIGFNGCGSTQFLRVPNSSSLQATSAMTVSFWARVDLSSGMDPGTGTCNSNGRHVFFAKAGDGWNTSLPGMLGLTYQSNGKQRVFFESPTNNGIVAVSGERDLPASSAWHYYTYVITSTQVNLYVDAQLVHTSTQNTSFAEANGEDLYLGVMGPKTSPVLGISYWYPLKGAMDEIRVYNKALTTQEITTLYQVGEEGCPPAPVAISAQGSTTVCEGESVTLKAESVPADVNLQWLRNGIKIPDQTNPEFTVTESGEYQLQVSKREEKWEWSMGGGQANSLNDVQYIGNNYGWIVGDNGTLMRTTDGSNWTTTSVGLSNHIYAVSFINPLTGWIAGENGLVMKTTDGGNTWQQLSISTQSRLSKVLFFNDNNGFVMSYEDLYSTTDGGNSWKKLSYPTPNSPSNIRFINENIGFVSNGGSISKTTNGGNTWTSLHIPNATHIYNFAFVNANTGWAVSSKQIYKTTDGGITWALQRDMNTSTCHLGNNLLYALDSNNCWFTFLDCFHFLKIARTTDGGNSWADSYYSPESWIEFRPQKIIFLTPQKGYAIGTSTRIQGPFTKFKSEIISMTSDGGQSWSSVYSHSHSDNFSSFPQTIVFSSTNNGVAVGWGGKILKLDSDGKFQDSYPNRTYQDLTSIAFRNSLDGVAYGGMLKLVINPYGYLTFHEDSKSISMSSTNGGASWTKSESKSSSPSYQIKYKKGSMLGWIAGYSRLSVTKDSGVTWNSISGFPPSSEEDYIITSAYCQTETSGFFITGYNNFTGRKSNLYKFSNNTLTRIDLPFKDINDPDHTSLNDLFFVNDRVGFITTSNGKLIRTTDGGTNWSIQIVRSGSSLGRCFFINDQVGWIICNGNQLLKTTNGGFTWSEQLTSIQSNNIRTYFTSFHFLSEHIGYLIGSEGVALKTTDGGATWIRQNTGTRNSLYDINFTDANQGWIVGANGTILKLVVQDSPCSSLSKSVAVVVKPKPSAPTLSSGSPTICSGSTTSLTATNCQGTINWSNGVSGASITVSPASTTTYSATCTMNGCTSSSSYITINVSNRPAAPQISTTSSSVCSGGSTSLSATGCSGFIQWSTGQTGNSITVTPTSTTTYTATCTVNGCTSPTSNVLSIAVSDGTICNSLSSGFWTSSTTWSCGRVPLSCDDVVIQPNHIVTLDGEGKASTIQTHSPSQLQFINGGSLKLGNQ